MVVVVVVAVVVVRFFFLVVKFYRETVEREVLLLWILDFSLSR